MKPTITLPSRNPDPKSVEALKSFWLGSDMMPSRSPFVYSYAEALFEMTLAWSARFWRPGDSADQRSMTILWAEQFEQANHGVQWGLDKDFFEEVDAYFDAQYEAWLAGAKDKVDNCPPLQS